MLIQKVVRAVLEIVVCVPIQTVWVGVIAVVWTGKPLAGELLYLVPSCTIIFQLCIHLSQTFLIPHHIIVLIKTAQALKSPHQAFVPKAPAVDCHARPIKIVPRARASRHVAVQRSPNPPLRGPASTRPNPTAAPYGAANTASWDGHWALATSTDQASWTLPIVTPRAPTAVRAQPRR